MTCCVDTNWDKNITEKNIIEIIGVLCEQLKVFISDLRGQRSFDKKIAHKHFEVIWCYFDLRGQS